jgi:hypothetical protein
MNPTARKTLAAIEAVGGLLGLALGVYLWARLQPQLPVSPWAAAFVFVAPSLPPIAAGLLWWQGHPLGASTSLGVWLLQVPVLISPTWAYFYSVGFGWRWMLGPDGLTNYMFLGTQWHWSVAERATGVTIGLNLVALTVVIAILWLEGRTHTLSHRSAMQAPSQDSA